MAHKVVPMIVRRAGWLPVIVAVAASARAAAVGRLTGTTASRAQTAMPGDSPRRGLVASYVRIRDTLRSNTPVPVLVPQHFLGRPADDSIYVPVQGADSVGYDLIFSPDPECEGETVCRFGSVSGQLRAKPLRPLEGQPVELAGGRTGFYKPSVCSAGCTDATIAWTSGPYLYYVGLKRGRVEQLVQAAESVVPLR